MAAKALFSGGSTGNLFIDRRKFYWDEMEVAELWKMVDPFLHFLRMSGGQKTVDDMLFKLFEHRSGWQKQQCLANLPGGDVVVPNSDVGNTIAIDNPTGLNSTVDSSYIGLTLEVWTPDSTATGFNQALTKKGVVVVTNVSGSDVTVKSLKTATVTISDNDLLIVNGNGRGEGSEAGEAYSDDIKTVFNSCQFFSVPINVTQDLYNAALRGYSNELARLRLEKSKEFAIQKSKAYLTGHSVLGTGMDATDGTGFNTAADSSRTDVNSNKIRTTMGIIPINEIYGASSGDSQNQWSSDINNIDYDEVLNMTEHIFQYNDYGGIAPVFCGRGYQSFWSSLAASDSTWAKQYNAYPMSQSELGYNTKMVTTPHGDLALMPTDAMKYQYHDTGVVVSPADMYEAVYEPEEFRNDVKKDNDYDGIKDVIRSKSGVGVTLQEKFHVHKVRR